MLKKLLAHYITYGSYTLYKSEQKMHSGVRIIFSTQQQIAPLVQDGKFYSELFDTVKTTTVSLPSLTTLSLEERYSLIDGFTDQAIKTNAFKNILTLNEKEKQRMLFHQPSSLYQLKTKVHQALLKKSKNSDLYHENLFDPAYEVTDPDLIHASRLGKQALKDHKIMVMLWDKFKNQNKIALFLGVNRSSVHRRFRELNIKEEKAVA